MTSHTLRIRTVEFVYVTLDEVRCRCNKLLGKNLEGSIEIKCPKCGHVVTYQKQVDAG